MNAASVIIQALLDAPDDLTVKGGLGSGPHARLMREDTYKIVVPGDSKGQIMHTVRLLLWDLSVDLDLPEEVRAALTKQFAKEEQ